MNLYEILALLGVAPTIIAMALLERATHEKNAAGTATMGTAMFVGLAWIIACTIANNA